MLYYIYFILLIILLLSTLIPKLYDHYIIFKTLTSICFMIITIINIYISNAPHRYLLLFPILFCMIGDIFLAIYNRYNKCFKLGLISFLIAHCYFVYNMCQILPFKLINIIFPIIMVIFVYILNNKQIINLKEKSTYCLIYAFFVSLLLSKAFDIYLNHFNIQAYLLLIGSILFFISEFILLFMYFKKRTKILHLLNLLTYYLAIYIFTIIIILN